MYIIIYKLFPNGFNTPQLIRPLDDALFSKKMSVLRSERSERWVFHLCESNSDNVVLSDEHFNYKWIERKELEKLDCPNWLKDAIFKL